MEKIIGVYNFFIAVWLLKNWVMFFNVFDAIKTFRAYPLRTTAGFFLVLPYLFLGILFIIAGVGLWRQKTKSRNMGIWLHILVAVFSIYGLSTNPHWQFLVLLGLSVFCIISLKKQVVG